MGMCGGFVSRLEGVGGEILEGGVVGGEWIFVEGEGGG